MVKDDMQESEDCCEPSSFDRDDIPEGGLAELDLEETRKALKEERKKKMWNYAESKLSEVGFS